MRRTMPKRSRRRPERKDIDGGWLVVHGGRGWKRGWMCIAYIGLE